ncbi:UDP-N-acetylmuramoyl-tripeptide--D-alanyl-D-alanine ligase [Paenibacillus sp. TRM 82003]|nr:UDP-N-acetylmuramoyl-tripeptide--D-alanyl-D-alanine ligase [Paenibacillus sp. TRM 82003]
MIRERLDIVAAYAQGELTDAAYGSAAIEGVSTDSRSVGRGNLFVPLIGERFNGHAYAEAALRDGAAAVLWQRDQGEPPAGGGVVLVDDTLAALQRLAMRYRQSLPVRIVGVTGSNGKTTTKDMIAAALATTYRVYKTQGNFNNHIGLPLTLLSLPLDTQCAVIEMGMSGRGEIELLTNLAKPDAAVITNIGDAHLLQLGSRDEIAKAKLEIRAGLAEAGTLVVPGDEPLIDAYLGEAPGPASAKLVRFGSGEGNDLRLASVELSADRTTFRLADSALDFEIPVLGRHNASNAVAAIAVARAFGVPDDRIAEGLRTFSPSGMRIERVAGKNGTTLWNDAYNASPSSMRAALSLLAETQGYKRKFAVLADMLELGPQAEALHREVGAELSPSGVDYVFAYGELGRFIVEGASPNFPSGRAEAFAEKEALAARLEQIAEPGDLILVKASRGMKLETIVQYMRNDP